MADDVLKSGRILVVQGPKTLPPDVPHAESISALCRDAELVLLFCFGDDRYVLPQSYILPSNARIIRYDYESIDESVTEVTNVLSELNVKFISRTKNDTKLPFVLSGGVIVLPPGKQIDVYSSHSNSKNYSTTGVQVDESLSTWCI